jgi:hypothetical protein
VIHKGDNRSRIVFDKDQSTHKVRRVSITYGVAGSKVSIKQKWHANEQKPTRVRTRHPLLVRHVSGFLCLTAAQKIIIGRGSRSAWWTMPERDIIPRMRQERLGGRPRFSELFRKSPRCDTWRGTLVSKSLTRDGKPGFKAISTGAQCTLKRNTAAKRPALSFLRYHANRDCISEGKKFRERGVSVST